MRYQVLHIESSFTEEWQKDLFDQSLCDAGVDTIDGEAYYIPSDQLQENRQIIESLCTETEGVKLLSIEECPDENWNAAWESEHPIQELPLGIRIIPHCAFGAGHHETTSMMIEQLINLPSSVSDFPCRVLDHGTGTGVLAIFAKRLGAQYVLAIDIDDKSVANAKENAALNGEAIDVRLGDAPPVNGAFDLILANIHRNILLANMDAYATSLATQGEVWFSGFYESDVPALQEAAEKEGLLLTNVLANGEWRLMKCRKEVH